MDVKEKFEQAKKKYSEMDEKKRRILLAVIALILILLLLLLLHCCGSGDGEGSGNPADGSSNPSISTDAGDNGGASSEPDLEGLGGEIGYDENLIYTWYLVDVAMVLREEGHGDLYYGDEDGGSIEWYTTGDRLVLKNNGKTDVVTYAVSEDELTITYSDGRVEKWTR